MLQVRLCRQREGHTGNLVRKKVLKQPQCFIGVTGGVEPDDFRIGAKPRELALCKPAAGTFRADDCIREAYLTMHIEMVRKLIPLNYKAVVEPQLKGKLQ